MKHIKKTYIIPQPRNLLNKKIFIYNVMRCMKKVFFPIKFKIVAQNK